MKILASRGAVRSCAPRPSRTGSERRTDYPDLAPPVNPQATPSEPPEPPRALSWPSWTDREVVSADVDPSEWPAWTDEARFIIPGMPFFVGDRSRRTSSGWEQLLAYGQSPVAPEGRK
jgi:hypothetical protein